MLQHFLESNGMSCSVIGTNQKYYQWRKNEKLDTTPNSLASHKPFSISAVLRRRHGSFSNGSVLYQEGIGLITASANHS